ncbi:MAG: hypothetical protein U1E39_00790 [Planctomycetota bacterium]
MRLLRRLANVIATGSVLAAAGCGGGGGGEAPPLFPAAVTAQDLVAVVYDDALTQLPRLSLADVYGRGEASVDALVIADGGVIDDLAWSPDHSRLAVLAQPDGVLDDILYVVEPLTGQVTAVSGPQPADSYVDAFAWSPDSSHLAFTRNPVGGDPIFVVRADGSGRIEVTGPAVPGGGVSTFDWSPDSTRLAFRGDVETQGLQELFVVNRDGSGRVKVSGAIVAGGGVGDFRWSPDATRLAVNGPLVTAGVFELFTVHADGSGTRARVHPNLPTGGDVLRFTWAPNGSRLAYIADQGTDEVFELFSSLPDGTGNVKPSGSIVAGGDVEGDFAWSPDGARIAFAADRVTDDVRELFTAPGDASAAPVKVSGPLVASGDVGGDAGLTSEHFAWSPDSTRIAYVADQEVDHAQSVYVTSAASATAVRVSPTPNGLTFANSLTWSPDSARVVFSLNVIGGGPFVATVAGPSQPFVPSEPAFLSEPFRPLSFAGDRLIVEFNADASDVNDVRSYDLVTRAEVLVAAPDAEPNRSLKIE